MYSTSGILRGDDVGHGEGLKQHVHKPASKKMLTPEIHLGKVTTRSMNWWLARLPKNSSVAVRGCAAELTAVLQPFFTAAAAGYK